MGSGREWGRSPHNSLLPAGLDWPTGVAIAPLGLGMAGTARMSAALTVGMAVGTGIATVGLALFHDGTGEIDDTEAGFTGAFHLGYGGHGFTPITLTTYHLNT